MNKPVKNLNAVQRLIGLSTAFLQRSKFFGSLGYQFGGDRKLYEVFGYDTNLTYAKMVGRYLRQDIAGRVVDAYPKAVWASPPVVKSNSDAWNKAWQDIVIQQNLWEVLQRLDKLACVGQYATLLIGFDDGKKLEDVVSPKNGRKVLYLQTYSCDSAEIRELNTDPQNKHYLMPEIYTLKRDLQNSSITTVSLPTVPNTNAHRTRIVHVAQNCLENTIIGSPLMERIYNILDDIIKTAGGSAENFWLTANRGIQANIDSDASLTAEDEAALTEEIEEYQHQLRRVIRTRGVEIKNLGSDIPDPGSTFSVLISLLSSATGIPQRVLTGAEAGQLASQQDRANWADRVNEYRSLYAEPLILWPFIKNLSIAGVLPTVDGLKITAEWPEAFRMSPLERAQAGAQRARSAVNMAKARTEYPQLLDDGEARSFIDLQPKDPVFDDIGDLGEV